MKPAENLHPSQREGNKPHDTGELHTPSSESPVTKDGDAVRTLDITQDDSTVPISDSKELEVIATVKVETNQRTDAEKEGEKAGGKARDGEKNEGEKTSVTEEKKGKEEGAGEKKKRAEAGKEKTADDDSILSTVDSDDLDELSWLSDETEDMVAKHQQHGAKYARVAGSYVKGLEARVGMLENHVRKLQTLLDSDKPLKDINDKPLKDIK